MGPELQTPATISVILNTMGSDKSTDVLLKKKKKIFFARDSAEVEHNKKRPKQVKRCYNIKDNTVQSRDKGIAS